MDKVDKCSVFSNRVQTVINVKGFTTYGRQGMVFFTVSNCIVLKESIIFQFTTAASNPTGHCYIQDNLDVEQLLGSGFNDPYIVQALAAVSTSNGNPPAAQVHKMGQDNEAEV